MVIFGLCQRAERQPIHACASVGILEGVESGVGCHEVFKPTKGRYNTPTGYLHTHAAQN